MKLRGNCPAKVDEKGRLKIPAVFLDALKEYGNQFYITSTTGEAARIYPMKVWLGIEGFARLLAPHTPVLLEEVLEWLRIRPDGTYIDATLGAGGHSEAIAEKLTSGRLISLDRDAQALELARQRLKIFGSKVTVVHAPFSRIAEVAQELGIPGVDGVLADLGVSSMQLDQGERGFSFREAAALDMRMDTANDELTADEIVNRWSEKEIADLLYREADEHDSRRIAKAIVRARPIRDTAHLATTVARARNPWGRERVHPATKTLRALAETRNRRAAVRG